MCRCGACLNDRARLRSQREGLQKIRNEMERVFQQQMVVTPLDTQNLSDDAKKVGKMLCYQIDKYAAALDALLTDGGTP